MHFLIQTNVAQRSGNYHGATRCFRSLTSGECWADRRGRATAKDVPFPFIIVS